MNYKFGWRHISREDRPGFEDASAAGDSCSVFGPSSSDAIPNCHHQLLLLLWSCFQASDLQFRMLDRYSEFSIGLGQPSHSSLWLHLIADLLEHMVKGWSKYEKFPSEPITAC